MKKRCKVVFILPNLNGGGAEKVTLEVIKNLNRNIFEPILFVLKKEGAYLKEVPSNISVIYGLEENESILKNGLTLIKSLLKVCRNTDVIVGSMELTATYFATIIGKILKKPIVGWVHTNMSEFQPNNAKIHRILMKCSYPYLDKIITVSYKSKESLENLIKGIEDKINVVYNPIDILGLEDKSNEKYPLKIKKPYILAIGRLVPEKGFESLIDAYSLLVKEGYEQDLIILGEGPKKEVLEQKIKSLGIKDRVNLLGFQSNPFPILKQASVFTMSSYFEGFSMVVLEALAMGVPVVATKGSGGPEEILESGKYGVLVENHEPHILANGIKKILNDPQLSEKIRQDGMQRALEFDMKSIVPKLEELLLEEMR